MSMRSFFSAAPQPQSSPRIAPFAISITPNSGVEWFVREAKVFRDVQVLEVTWLAQGPKLGPKLESVAEIGVGRNWCQFVFSLGPKLRPKLVSVSFFPSTQGRNMN